jgi:hypothetical protein
VRGMVSDKPWMAHPATLTQLLKYQPTGEATTHPLATPAHPWS